MQYEKISSIIIVSLRNDKEKTPKGVKELKIMEIKKLLTKMEQANQFAEMVGDVPYVLECCFDDCDTKKFATFKAFKKYLDEEYINAYTEELLKQNIKLSTGWTDVFFSWSYQYGTNAKQEVKCHLSLAIYKEQR